MVTFLNGLDQDRTNKFYILLEIRLYKCLAAGIQFDDDPFVLEEDCENMSRECNTDAGAIGKR